MNNDWHSYKEILDSVDACMDDSGTFLWGDWLDTKDEKPSCTMEYAIHQIIDRAFKAGFDTALGAMIFKKSSTDSNVDYKLGYNAGYEVGYDSGYEAGYSNGIDYAAEQELSENYVYIDDLCEWMNDLKTRTVSKLTEHNSCFNSEGFNYFMSLLLDKIESFNSNEDSKHVNAFGKEYSAGDTFADLPIKHIVGSTLYVEGQDCEEYPIDVTKSPSDIIESVFVAYYTGEYGTVESTRHNVINLVFEEINGPSNG